MDPFIGQIEIFGFNFAPRYWAFCGGQLIPIQQNTALFALIGTTYGGNGTTNFELPNLAARQAAGAGSGPGLTPRALGEVFGVQSVTLTTDQMPTHAHTLTAFVPTDTSTMTVTPGQGGTLGAAATEAALVFAAPGTAAPMNPQFIQPSGGSMPHNNIQPFLGLNYSIALSGVFPSFP